MEKELKNTGIKKLNDELLVNTGLNIICKKIKRQTSSITGSGITLRNNQIKDIVKVIKSLEKQRNFIKGTTRKCTSQEGEYLNFLQSLMTAGLPLMKNVLTPLDKSILIPLGLTTAALATDAAIQKKIYGLVTTALII